ncbi:MAG: efflux RND transporter periplasmic adaptor subunit [Odoribacter sp.]|nr:efflux RND transporter periplasmic adaptor subunit [Odoribacter sp.]
MPGKYYIIIWLALRLASCSGEQTPDLLYPPRPVRTVKIESLETTDKTYTGIAEASQFSILAFKISGTLTELNVKQGQWVPQGYTIARINPADYELKYQTAETDYQTARSINQRTHRLLEQNAIALQNAEISQADYIQANSAVSIAKNTLAYTSLHTPFGGIIEQRYVENYQQVAMGESIVKLVNPAHIEVSFTLPETAINLIHSSKKIFVRFDTRKDHWYEAEVKEYVYSSEGSGIPVTLRITDKNFNPVKDEIYPGFSCQILFRIENTIASNFVIPASALYTQNSQTYVWVVDPANKTVSLHPVKAVRFEDKAVVQTGLNSHDIIVTAGICDLQEGQKVSLHE